MNIPYQNFGFNNYNPYLQNYMNQQMPVQQQMQPQTNTNKIYVSGIDDVKGRYLQPNSDVMFIDNDKPLLYEKIVDSKGQFEIKVFDVSTHKEDEQKDDYAKKSDIDSILTRLSALENKGNTVTATIE